MELPTMHPNLRMIPLFLLTIAALTLAACGGSAAAAKPASDSAPIAAPPAGAAAAEAAPAADDDAEAATDEAGGASDLVVTGAVELQMKKTGNCGMNPLMPGHFDFGFDNSAEGFEFYGEDDLWLLHGTIRGYEGPDTFETAEDSSGKAGLELTDMMGRSFVSPAGGTFTIDAGEAGGSLDVTLVDEDAGETVTVSGTFSCEPY
jgi:hypothetical protein